MKSKMNTKVRLVRCPRCRKVLAELPDVPVYRCGGCDAVLQAKKPKDSTVDAKSPRLEEDSSGKQKMEFSHDNEAGSSSLNQQSLDRNRESHSSTELSRDEDPESSPEARAHNGMDQDAAKKPENGGVDATSGGLEDHSFGKRKMEQFSDDEEIGNSLNQRPLVNSIDEPDRNSDHNEPRTSTELSCHGDPESSPEATAHNIMDQDAAKKPMGGPEEHSSGKRKMEQLSDGQESGYGLNQEPLINSIDEADRNHDHNKPRSSTELLCHEEQESSPEPTSHNRLHQDQEQEKDHDAVKKPENGRVDATSGGLEEHSSSKWKTEQLSDGQITSISSNRQWLVNSIDEPDRNSDPNEPRSSSELSYHGDPQSSPEATAPYRMDQDHDHYHNQDLDMFMAHGVSENCKNGAEFEETSRGSSASLENYSSSKLNKVEEPSQEAIANMKILKDSDGGSKSNFKSLIAEKLLDTRQRKVANLDDEDDTLSEDESADLCHRRRFERISSVETLEKARSGGTSYHGYEGSVSSFDGNDNLVNRVGSEGDKHVDSRNGRRMRQHHEFHPSDGRSTGVRSFYGYASPSRLGFNEFQENPRHRSQVIPENARLERLELLKMVRELQDQLERRNVAQQVPSYYNGVLNHPGRYGQRMAFSGEAGLVNRNRDRDGNPCYRCRPQDRRFSAQLPQQLVCCNGPHYVPSPYYNQCFSGPSSPQHHSGSEFSIPTRTRPDPDDHQHRNNIRKPNRSPQKRHVRPIAGGAPLVTCYRCSELLQLPQSFLVFKRRYHSLRCGACRKVLNFTLSNGTRVDRYYPEETIAAPPSSEVDDYADSTASRAGPVSCSVRSYQKSYSTETDKHGSRELIKERRKATMSKDPSSSSSKVSARRKVTSEIEEIPPPSSGSPLHRLMGYASPSKVIRG